MAYIRNAPDIDEMVFKMVSDLELRHIIESGFFPNKCVCTISPYHMMTVQIFDEETGEKLFTSAGIDTQSLVSIRDIARLVLELKEEMKLRKAAPALKPRKNRSW